MVQIKTGHVMRVVSLDEPDALRGSVPSYFLGDEWDGQQARVLPEIIRPMMVSLRGRAAVSRISAHAGSVG